MGGIGCSHALFLGCAFDRFLHRTPSDLVSEGLYNDRAVPLFPSGEETKVALAQLYMKIAQSESTNRHAVTLPDLPVRRHSLKGDQVHIRKTSTKKTATVALTSIVVQGSLRPPCLVWEECDKP